jgi:formylglycine-generating enzyme required for sulfatase activity
MLATLKEQNDWIRFGGKLRRAGLAPIVLTPVPRRIWSPELAFLFKMAYWDRNPEMPRLTGSGTKGLRPLSLDQGLAGIQKLKTLLAPAVRVEPQLLRAARLLLTADGLDAGHEAGVWNHPDIISTYTGFSFRTKIIKELRRRFITHIPKETQRRICDLIQTHHRHLPTAVVGEEKMIADLLMHGSPSQTSEQYFRRSAKALSEIDRRKWPGLDAWLWRVVMQRQDDRLWQSEAMNVIWALINRDDWTDGKIDLPAGLLPERIMWILAKDGEPKYYTLFRQGGNFVVQKSIRSQGIDHSPYTLGSPVADFLASNGVLQVCETGTNPKTKYALNLQNNESVAFKVPTNNRLQLLTDHTEITLKNTQKPSWAKGWGRDEKGLFLILPHGKQTRKAYWFAPGRYPLGDDAGGSMVLDDPHGTGLLDGGTMIDIKQGFWWDERECEEYRTQGFGKPPWAHRFGKDKYGLFADFKIKGVVQRMRWIMPGEFMMGSPKFEPERDSNEEQHEVILTKGFWLAETACTQALWRAVMGENPSRFKGNNLPVENISWEDCQIFIGRLNTAISGLDVGLPTEAQWEYACRAGTTTPFHFGETVTTDQANFHGDYPYNKGPKGEYRRKTVSVKTFPCNAWGLYEMHGNVWEWCRDWYGDYPKGSVIDPKGPSSGSYRVLRGGSWFNYGRFVRSAYRLRFEPAERNVVNGLRLARGQTAGQGSGGAGQSKEDSDQPITSSNTAKRDKKSGIFKGIFKK